MGDHEQFVLQITAGPSYDESTHSVVNVNTDDPIHISSEEVDASVRVRVQHYRGLPSTAPHTSDYFSSPQHSSDRYSIDFRFTPKRNISGNDMLFGNDFDRPIRDRLPPGFNTAFKFAKWMIDPGLDGDPYSDTPYLYGPLLSSINVLKFGSKKDTSSEAAEEKKDSLDVAESARDISPKDEDRILEEGANDEEGWEDRAQFDMPDESAARKKFYLDESRRKEFEFEKGREYQCDFFNPYLDFNEFAVRLPGITIPILKHMTGQQLRDHTLRYVLRDRATDSALLVIVIKLLRVSELTEPHNVSSDEGREAHRQSVTVANGNRTDDAGPATLIKKSVRRPRFLSSRPWKSYMGRPTVTSPA